MLGSSPSMTIGGRGEGLLQQPQAPEARVAGAADDEVVVDGDAELLGGAAQFLGHGDVGGRGLGVAARMGVDEDEGGGAPLEIGRASSGESGCMYVSVLGVGG